MLKKLGLHVIVFILGVLVGYFSLTPKEKIVIKYKDRVVKVKEMKVVTKYKDGTTITKYVKDTVEVEKEKVVDKVVYSKTNFQLAPMVEFNASEIKSTGFVLYKNIFGDMSVGLGINYRFDTPDKVLLDLNNNPVIKKPSFFDNTTFIVSAIIPI